MLLIYPPCAKACELPAGIAKLAGTLKTNGFAYSTIDANLEGQLFLLDSSPQPFDTWGRRAYKNLPGNLQAVRDTTLYKYPARYDRTVIDINKILELFCRGKNLSITLANYVDGDISPSRSSNLLLAAATYKENIFYPYFSERIAASLLDNAHSLVGFSLTYLSQAICTFAMIGFIKEHFPKQKIVLGGGLVTSWMSNPSWNNPFHGIIDHLIAGPGEEKLVQLLSAQKKVTIGKPDYTSLLTDLYIAPGYILPYAASSGCYWRKCSFCPEKAEGNPYKKNAPEMVIQEITELSLQTNPKLVHFLDNAICPELLKTIVDKPFGINWYGFARVSSSLTEMKFCKGLRDSGCVMLKIGLESGSQKVLNAMNKGIQLDKASKALTTLKQAGVSTYVYLLFGTPNETLKEARETLAFVEKHSEAITYLNLAIFNMPIDAEESATVETRDFSEGDLSLYTDFIHGQGWGRKQVRQFLDNEFKCHPAVKKILQRTPPYFTSNHAPFFQMFTK